MNEALALLSYGPNGWGDELAQGLWLTIRLALTALPIGLTLGFFLALAKLSSEPWLRHAANIYTTVFRGVPELVTLFVVYYGGQTLLQQVWGMFSSSYVEVSGFVAGVIALSFVFSAFASEVFLSAFRGIPQGQYEGAQALGLSRFQTMRKVILPQLIQLALPGLSNLWLVLLKDTALVSVIALDDLLRKTNVAVGSTKEPFLFYMTACLIYLALSLSSSALLTGLNKRVNRGLVR